MKQNKKVIAITGGIGSGKSTVRKILTEKGYVCFDCDEINSCLLQQRAYIMGLKEVFPYAFNGEIFHKEVLRRIIFSEEAERKKLNAYAHKRIFEMLKSMVDARTESVIFCEVPLLNEVNDDFLSIFTEIWEVVSDEETRIRRVVERDNRSADAIRKIVYAQKKPATYEQPIYVIQNEGNIGALRKQIEYLLQKI